jgi:hypothetical protein
MIVLTSVLKNRKMTMLSYRLGYHCSVCHVQKYASEIDTEPAEFSPLPSPSSFFIGLGFELRASHLQSRSLLLDPHLQSILLWLIWKWDLTNYLPVASTCDSPDLSLPSS